MQTEYEHNRKRPLFATIKYIRSNQTAIQVRILDESIVKLCLLK